MSSVPYVSENYESQIFCGLEVEAIKGTLAVITMLGQNEKPTRTALEFHAFLISQKPL
jgi:hypothetical protein